MAKSKNRAPLDLPPTSLTPADHDLLTKKAAEGERKRKEELVLRQAFQGGGVKGERQHQEPVEVSRKGQRYKEIPPSHIQPGKYQPRRTMNAETHEDLVRSIKVNGLLNPILVREIESERYEIIAGERRWRACKELQFETIPALVQERDDRKAAIQSLLDNIVREDLSAYDQAVGMQRLMKEFNLKQFEIAEELGLSQGRVSQCLAILELPESILQLMFQSSNGMTESHARVLLPVKDNLIRLEHLAREAVSKGWSRDKLKAEVEKQPRTNAGAQSVRLQYRGFQGTNGFQLQIRYHPNRSHEKDLVKQALQEAMEYLETGRAPLSSQTTSPES